MMSNDQRSVELNRELLQMAELLGNGNPERGVSRALRAMVQHEANPPSVSQRLRGVACLVAGLELDTGTAARLSVHLRGLVDAVCELEERKPRAVATGLQEVASAAAVAAVAPLGRPRCASCGRPVLRDRTLPHCSVCARLSPRRLAMAETTRAAHA
jgi:hypothetical protein